MVGTRKLAAILAADVAGYSRLTGADEEGTLARIRALRVEIIDPALAVYRGRVANTAGDSLLAEFASAVEALRAAIDIQRAMAIRSADFVADKRIEFRIGVHVGDIMVEEDGDLRGDGVNIAARLEGIAKPGGICLSEDAYRQVRSKLELSVSDLGELRLKNIAEPVRAYLLSFEALGSAKGAAPIRRAPLAAGLAALLFVAGAAAWGLFVATRPAGVATNAPAPAALTPAAPAHLSIVVLPFTNLSGGPAQDYFADAITENLTTDLSRIRNSFVIARNTAFTFKGKNVDAKEIGKELGIRYLLEGSVQREQGHVRVNAQLIDAQTGAHLWADRFEEDIADLFKLQDQIVARLANSLGIELIKAEASRGAVAVNPDAVDLTMRGWALARKLPQTAEAGVAALALFEQALKIDPNAPDALAGEAYAYMFEGDWARRLNEYDTKILGQADKAIELAPDTLWAYYVKCVYLYYTKRADKAVSAADAGLAIDPNFAPLLAVRGIAELFLGRFEPARSDILKSNLLSPREPLAGISYKYLGDTELGLGHFDDAVEDYHKAINRGFVNMWPYVSLTAGYALAGKMDEARTALAEARRLEPDLSIKFLIPIAPPIPNLFDGLRKAGLPEAEAAHLSLVVLPFTNLSNDPAQDYFADGVTENLTTDLSRIPNSFVIARNTAFTYKGKAVDVKQIGKELGVRYVLEGSVQRDQNRVRVNAELIDAQSGADLWADRFEDDLADLFKLQDQVVARLGNAVGFELVKAEADKGVRSENPDALDLAMRGWATMWRSYSQPVKDKRDSHYAALALFEQALKIDPDDADALAGEAFAQMALFVFGEAAGDPSVDAKVLEPADRAIALAPDNMRAYHAKSAYLAVTHRAHEALRAADSGLAINPNYAPLLDARALSETTLGRFEQAKSDVKRAISLSPRDPEIGSRVLALGLAELGLGNFDAAVVEFQKEIDAGDRSFIPYVNLAAAYALEGRTEEAKTALAEGRRLNPQLTVKWLANHAPSVPALFEGVRKAGLAEQ